MISDVQLRCSGFGVVQWFQQPTVSARNASRGDIINEAKIICKSLVFFPRF